MSKYITYSY